MIHGGIGHINNDRIFLSEDLLKPISIRTGKMVFGIYYPPRMRYGIICRSRDKK